MLWNLMFVLLVVQAAAVVLLIFPVPSNYIRGLIVAASNALADNYYFRQVQQILIGITCLLFFESLRQINRLDEHIHADLLHNDTHRKMQLCFNQRNSYISGFSLFMTFLLFRLQGLVKQHFEAKTALKNAGYDDSTNLKKTGSNKKIK